MEDNLICKRDELKYSEEAEASRFFFYTDINDINIFVEDKDKEYIYETIFKRMFKNKYSIYSIISVGGKINLEKSFYEFGTYDKDNKDKKNIYIADGDFDRIIGKEMIDNVNFIYLFDYNIENYLIDKEATYSFAKGKLKALDSEVKDKVMFDEWREKIVGQAFKLFILYSTIQKYNADIQNVQRSPYLFLDNKNGLERVGTYDEFYNEIKDKIDNLDEKIEEIMTRWNTIYDGDKEKIICGKFLFTSLSCHIKNITNKKIVNDDFIWNLVQHFDMKKLNYIKERIENIMIS
ncbi:DUF4435 domain-containing protein [Clostridium perfringens]